MPSEVRRKALVTGGARGIGAATARRLAADGFAVVIFDLEDGESIAKEIGGGFDRLDVTDVEGVDRLVGRRGPFDVVVNNAGIDQHAFFTDLTPADWRRLLSVNLEGAFAVTRAALPAMQAARSGRIVNVSSEAGRLGSKGGAVYAAAKAGVIGFTRSIARENARYAVTANVVLPGPIRTPMVAADIARHGKRVEENLRNLTLLRRLGEPEEVAAAIAFLASPAASYITGEVLGVSGGMGCGVA